MVYSTQEDVVENRLAKIRGAGQYRVLREVTTAQNIEITLDGRRVINFSSNNSLGLANHPAVCDAARAAVSQFGTGSGASRLLSGNMEPHVAFEKKIAHFLRREDALFFSSGYLANIGAIPVLAEKDAVILSDELNHASIIDGIRLSRAECRIYPHNDLQALRKILEGISADIPLLLITESLFSMEGDRAPLADIARLKRVRPFMLYVDEAHAMGATGPSGEGLVAEAGCGEDVDILLGTLGKVFGSSGAFVSSNAAMVDLLINSARSFIYSTAPSPVSTAAASAALDIVKEGDGLREKLRNNTALFREGVGTIIDDTPPGIDHIVPVICPGADPVMKACESLLQKGIFCQAIRPPTVPVGRCRLRFSISALHTEEQIEKAIGALGEVLGR